MMGKLVVVIMMKLKTFLTRRLLPTVFLRIRLNASFGLEVCPIYYSCKITKNVSVCEKHFPPDCQRIKKPGGYLVPAVPPSIFGDTKCSLFVSLMLLPSMIRIDSEEDRRQISFIGKQLLLFNRHRYTSQDMAEAIHLYLRSRNSYRALRELLVLPCRNTIGLCDYFGKNGLAGGANECESYLVEN